jgi:cell fate regulator YaaT (PSP1 superfamily)
VDPQYERMKAAWEALETAQDVFLNATDIDIEEDPIGIAYLDEPGEKFREVVKKYAAFLNRSAELEQTHLQQKAQQDRDAVEEDRK